MTEHAQSINAQADDVLPSEHQDLHVDDRAVGSHGAAVLVAVMVALTTLILILAFVSG